MFFDAAYFVLEASADLPDPEIWPGELVDGGWWTVQDALHTELGELSISYPVLETLRILKESDTIDTREKISQHCCEPATIGGEMVAGLHMLPVKTLRPPAAYQYLFAERRTGLYRPGNPHSEEQEKLCDYVEHVTKLRGGRLNLAHNIKIIWRGR